MRFVSLFAGVGGFDLAFERAGMDCVGQVEIDKHCREVLSAHWPEVPKWGDIHDVTASGLLTESRTKGERVGNCDGTSADVGRPANHPSHLLDGGTDRTVDVLCGGFPCQDYSVAGKRGGLVGDRGALWWQFHRLIAECRPTWVVGENVPGLLSSNGGRDFGTIVGSLVELGYGVVWRVLDAQYFGVAQRRRRVFIVGHIGGIPRPEILAFAEGMSGDTPPRRTAGTRAAPTLASRIRGGGGLGTDTELDGALVVQGSGDLGVKGRQVGSVGVVLNGGSQHPTDEAQFGGGEGHNESFRLTETNPTKPAQEVKNFVANTLKTPSGGLYVEDTYIAFAQNTRDEVRELGDNIAGALAAQPGMKQTTYLAFNWQNFTNDGLAISEELTGPLDTSQTKAMASPQGVRRLTPLECERLQGFPDNWTAGQSDTQRYRQMGNAVAVPVAEWVGRRLVGLKRKGRAA